MQQVTAREPSASDIPIVFLSAHSSEETVQRVTEAAPFGYLVKPFRAPELRCAIEVAIRRHAAEKRIWAECAVDAGATFYFAL